MCNEKSVLLLLDIFFFSMALQRIVQPVALQMPRIEKTFPFHSLWNI